MWTDEMMAMESVLWLTFSNHGYTKYRHGGSQPQILCACSPDELDLIPDVISCNRVSHDGNIKASHSYSYRALTSKSLDSN